MFHPLPQPQDFFACISNSKIEYILQPAEILVNFRTQNFKAQKHCLVYVEKIDSKGLFQLRFTEKCDRRKMYITTVDGSSFQQLKHDQSLNVTFSGFVENLIHILKECHAGKMDINIMEFQPDRLSDTSTRSGDSLGRYELQFIENRPFKNLIHLCLPCRAAPQNMVLFYMNNILDEMQKKLLEQEQNTQHLQLEIQNRNQQIEQLDEECTKVRDNLLETTRSINQKNSKEIMELQERLRKSTEQRQQDNERSRNTINALQQQIDKVVGEKSIVQTEKCNAQKHNDMLKEELSALKINLTNLTESNEKLYNEISALKNLERKNEMHLKDCRKEVNDCKEIIKKHEKCKAELVAELEAEKKISQTKRQALEIATEEISKANEIILKQRQELCKLKKVIDWRTEVSLQQEQAIKMKDIHIKERNDQIISLKQTLDSLRTDIPKELDSMRKFAAALDTKYSEQITAMQLKLKPLEKDGKKDVTGNTRRK